MFGVLTLSKQCWFLSEEDWTVRIESYIPGSHPGNGNKKRQSPIASPSFLSTLALLPDMRGHIWPGAEKSETFCAFDILSLTLWRNSFLEGVLSY